MLEQVQVVRVSSEDTFIVHDIESLTVILFIVIVLVGVVSRGVLELVLLADHFGLGTLERLSHIFKFILLLNQAMDTHPQLSSMSYCISLQPSLT